MKRVVIFLFILAIFGLEGCATSANRTCTQAAVPATDNATVEEQLRIIRTDVAALRSDIRALRGDLAAAKASGANTANRSQTPPDMTHYEIAIGSSPVLGTKDAPITIVEFIDFQCLYCVREYPKLKKIVQEYPDKVKVVFKHFPLDIHRNARPAHAAAELAKMQGDDTLFWKMHDMIMASPKKLDISSLRQYAKSINLDIVTFDKVMSDPNEIDDLLSADLAEGKKCTVRATPAILINGVKLADRTDNGYRTRINTILADQKLQPVN